MQKQAPNQERSKLLGEMSMNKLVPKISVPIMFSMLIQALYNVVDSIFVSRFDPDALTAVSLAYPIQMLMIALSTGMGVGINSLISRKLGEKRQEEARRAAWNGVFVELCSFLLFLIIGVFFSGMLLDALTSDSLQNAEKITQMGTTYLSIVCTFSLGLFMSITLERMLQATGNTMLSMVTQLSGAVTNIILDPIMIFGMNLGVAGAAIATVIGQWVGMVLGFFLNQYKNRELILRLPEFRLDTKLLAGIFTVGLPSTVMSSISSVMNIGMNGILSGFAQGNDAVNVLNVYFKLQSFVFMPVFGLSNGLVAIIAYNFGAHLKQRVYEAVKVALRYAVTIMAVGMLIFLLFPEALMSLFQNAEAAASSSMTQIGVVALRTICLHFILAAIGISLSTVFQAVGKGTYSLIMSLCRQLIVLLPAAWLLAKISLDAVWWAFLIAEAVSLTICLVLYRKCDREMISTL